MSKDCGEKNLFNKCYSFFKQHLMPQNKHIVGFSIFEVSLKLVTCVCFKIKLL